MRSQRDIQLQPRFGSVLAVSILCGLGCSGTDPADAFDWSLPERFPEPRVPDDNAMSDAKVELGRHLFYDERLSQNETQSCASCHEQDRAFSDGQRRPRGSTGQEVSRNSMSLANVAYGSTLTWANPTLRTLEAQTLIPLFGQEPVELGFESAEALIERLSTIPLYESLFAEAFPERADPFEPDTVSKALAAFQRTIISGDSPYDRFIRGETGAMSEAARRGLVLFNSERLECFHCHGGFNFSSSVDHDGKVFDEANFQNNGLYNVDGEGAYPAPNTGLHEFTGHPLDMGRFKPPTLRNIALTAPYMHDGSIATLEEVVEHYSAGGRNVTTGPNAGDGRENPNKSGFVTGFTLSDREKQDLIAFLEALTDNDLTTRESLSNPFRE